MNPFSAIFSAVSGALGGIWGYVAALGIGAVVAGAGVGWTVHKIDHDAYVSLQLADSQAATRAVQVADQERAAKDKAALDAAVAEASAQQKIVTQTEIVTRKVPIYVHDKILCPGGITFGVVRVLYAAEHGLDPAAVDLPTGQSDDACAAYEPSAFAADLASDFGDARANAEQLNALESAVVSLNAAGQPSK